MFRTGKPFCAAPAGTLVCALTSSFSSTPKDLTQRQCWRSVSYTQLDVYKRQHSNLSLMNGWKTGTSRYTTVRAMGSYNGNICYCIEIGVPQQTGDSFTKKGEDFWDNYPSSYNLSLIHI